MVNKFEKARAAMHWTNRQQLFRHFASQFDDFTKWDVIAAQHNQTIAGFDEAMVAFIAQTFPSNAWECHKTMIQSVTKPFKMTPREFMNLLRFHNSLLEVFPGFLEEDNPLPRPLSDYE
jgi:hypothetical protein